MPKRPSPVFTDPSNKPIDSGGESIPRLHLEFIQNQAALPGDTGAEAVEAFHRSLFLFHHAPQLENWDQQARGCEDRLRRLEARLSEVQGQFAGLSHLLANPLPETPERAVATPWNLWDAAMFGLAGIGVVGLLWFGILNVSFNLLESGLVTFQENPLRAYLWTALLPVGALAVKVGWDSLRGGSKRGIYLWACLWIGVAGVLTWVGAYAAIYPSLSKTTAERIQSLSVFDNPGSTGGLLLGVNAAGTRWIDVILVGSQAIAEIFLSAVLGIHMTQIFQRHHASRSSANPRFRQLEEEHQGLERTIGRERSLLAEARGQRIRLEHQLDALVAYARSAYQREVIAQRDQNRQQRVLLDHIAEQLRDQFGTSASPNGREDSGRPTPRPIGNLETL